MEETVLCPETVKTDKPKTESGLKIPPYERTTDKVAIIGCSDSKNIAPFKESGWEFWGVNNLFLSMPDKPWTRWFEIHSFQKQGKQYLRRWKPEFRGQLVNDYLMGLGKLAERCPVYVNTPLDLVPNGVKYPIDKITKLFGRYFTNTISYEIALAIYMGYKEIGIWGVDMAVSQEYIKQRPSCEVFIGLAIGRGIKVTIPGEADLLKTRFLYGFEEKKEDDWMMKVNNQVMSMQNRLMKEQQVAENAKRKIEQYVGAISCCQEQKKIWGNL